MNKLSDYNNTLMSVRFTGSKLTGMYVQHADPE